jgi:2-amino-4-hydroxy-6-hydroxymethyldihydropteridine diphosphokinase
MPTCLLGLGSNLGDRNQTLRAAITELDALVDVQLVRHSDWHRSRPIGGPTDQGEYLNAAALFETSVAPYALFVELQKIELRHGRTRAERWAPRTLDIDLLLYDNEVIQTDVLTLPHPRMSFRRFVLEPAAEVAPKMLHPIIGWPVDRLLMHLNLASDQVALVTPSADLRNRLGKLLHERCGARVVERPTFATADHHWPSTWTTWFAFPSQSTERQSAADAPAGLPYAAAAFPKLTIMLDANAASPADKLQWSTIVPQPGRGPTLRLHTADPAEIDSEVLAAIEAVWPDLGPANTNRLESK